MYVHVCVHTYVRCMYVVYMHVCAEDDSFGVLLRNTSDGGKGAGGGGGAVLIRTPTL